MSSRILIVEDDAMIRGFLRLTLENDGYEVTAAHTAGEMREQFQAGGIDLIILDLGLPDADGMDLVTEIRSASPIPILVASARQGSVDRVEALKRGANDYLTKPFDPAELLVRLKNMLDMAKKGAPVPEATPTTGPAPAPAPPPFADRRAPNKANPTGDRRAQPAAGQPTGDRRAGARGPVPPAANAEPVSPLPPSPAATVPPAQTPPGAAAPAPAPVSAEASLQAAAKKSAPQPIHPPPEKPSVDKSVIFAGVLAIAAFGGAGVYWYNTSDTPQEVAARLSAADPRASNQSVANTAAPAGSTIPTTPGDPRRGALQPPAEPDVRIARSNSTAPDLTRSVTSPPTPQPQSAGPAPTSSVPPQAGTQLPAQTSDPQTSALSNGTLPPLSTAWVSKSKCAPLPDVKWWRVKTHQQVVRFVNREHNGDWLPYVNNWRARIEKLKDISDRGSGIKTSSGVILQGESLAEYIRDTADRIAIIQCLAREARIATGR